MTVIEHNGHQYQVKPIHPDDIVVGIQVIQLFNGWIIGPKEVSKIIGRGTNRDGKTFVHFYRKHINAEDGQMSGAHHEGGSEYVQVIKEV